MCFYIIFTLLQELVLFLCVKRINKTRMYHVKNEDQFFGALLMLIPGTVVVPPLILLIVLNDNN